jgi:hypothetical protein
MADHLDAARQRVREERRRTVDERAALTAFLERLDSVATDPSDGFPVGLAVLGQSSSGLSAVQDAYEATVMSVPHYAEEYGDTYAESVTEEFGLDLAAALTQGSALPSSVRAALVDSARAAREERVRFVEALDEEASSLAYAESVLADLLDELAARRERPIEGAARLELDAAVARLRVLERKCDDLAADRQAFLREQRRGLSLSLSGPDLPTYLYQDCEVTYPVLATVAEASRLVSKRRRRSARELALR